MGWRLPSYKPDGDIHCFHGSNKDEPCWGQVQLTDEECTEDYSECWVYHQCEAHALCHTSFNWSGYKTSPYAEDAGAPPVEDGEA